jgi:hypothetical protein
MAAPAWMMIAITIWLGLDTRVSVGAASQAAVLLIGGGR